MGNGVVLAQRGGSLPATVQHPLPHYLLHSARVDRGGILKLTESGIVRRVRHRVGSKMQCGSEGQKENWRLTIGVAVTIGANLVIVNQESKASSLANHNNRRYPERSNQKSEPSHSFDVDTRNILYLLDWNIPSTSEVEVLWWDRIACVSTCRCHIHNMSFVELLPDPEVNRQWVTSADCFCTKSDGRDEEKMSPPRLGEEKTQECMVLAEFLVPEHVIPAVRTELAGARGQGRHIEERDGEGDEEGAGDESRKWDDELLAVAIGCNHDEGERILEKGLEKGSDRSQRWWQVAWRIKIGDLVIFAELFYLT
ncbi:hypothetical protein C8F04DRAFT_1186793 [Mycena alexandri]|uniref:Uncharacterized protein n=1 Tax=Mycena alexandri TaxID=1745969 RepID=A0AAD6X321_9AGAR|nr:hypothetical protein C8F04DRAFT_1186793 [Mycena alexandri]